MRVLLALVLIGCSTGPQSRVAPDPEPDPASEPTAQSEEERDMTARTLARMPDQGPPDLPKPPVKLGEVDWKHARWRSEDGLEIAMDPDVGRLAVNGTPTQTILSSHGGYISGGPYSLPLQALTPCAVVSRHEGAPVHLVRAEPPCAPEEQGYADPDQRFATFTLNTNDRYTFMGDAVVWRHGPERAFNHPRGSRAPTEHGWTLTFGESHYDVRRLDGCQVVFVHDTDRAYRGVRSFPACTEAERTYDAWPWSLWELADGTRLDLRGDALHIDQAGKSEDLVLPITVEGSALQVGEAGPGRITMEKTGPCTARAIRGDQALGATRLFPRCD